MIWSREKIRTVLESCVSACLLLALEGHSSFLRLVWYSTLALFNRMFRNLKYATCRHLSSVA